VHLLISALVATIPLAIVIWGFERARPKPRDLMPVVVLTALAILGRVVTMPIPNFQPATALIVLTGLFFGKHAGMLSGMLVALVSNMIMGQGPWTPWQMLAWGLVGYGAGILGTLIRDKGMYKSSSSANFNLYIFPVLAYGAVASLLFGMFMDLQYFIAFAWETSWPGLLTTVTLGLPFNIAHAASTIAFLALTLIPWGKKLHRLKTKYNIRPI